MPERRIPGATYRLQLQPGFGFDQAAEVMDYLAALGVTHAYFSPYLQAASGSTHGYDVVDHSRVSEDLGGGAGHARLLEALDHAGVGQVVDIVPNHMSIGGPENRWWWDVLENGRSSRYALYFDISWEPPEPRLKNRVLLPVLGDHYGRVLERGELVVEREGARFSVRYFDHRAPLAPTSLPLLLRPAAERAGSEELRSLSAALAALADPEPNDEAAVEQRQRRRDELLGRLDDVLQEHRIREAVDSAVRDCGADPDRLDALLEAQHYRLARWQTASWDLDYRRFFDINTLAALRMREPRVFEDAHRLVLGWVDAGVVDGLRVDHPDGLRDPKGYFDQLRCRAPQAWIVAEKILEPAERLPEDWPVDGTTGYDFANRCLGLFIDPSGEAPLTRLYEELAGESREYPEVAHAKKHQVLRELLASDVNRLVALLIRICERHRDYRDYTRRELDDALREVIASFPVYRTYVRPDAGAVSADDVHHVGEATASAGEHRPDLDPDLFAFIRDLLLLRHRGDVEDEFTWRFQQTTAPVMAKAVEDTAFYSYNRLVCLNEVGGDPDRFGVSLADFHAACAAAAKRWPFSMLASSTHDTKRSEDVRARLALLSEVPDEWGENVRRWVEMNAHQKTLGIPDPNTEYLLYQTLVGAHPLDADRAVAYMEKASKEAKEHTSWLDPNPEHDAALRDFVAAILQDHDFTASLRDFAVRLTQPGRVNSLAAKLLTLTSPGVGDIYQGTELWDLTLVDPDNRRPVDFALRRRLLAELDDLSAADVWARAEEGLPKLLVVKRALELRRERPAAFTGAYEPLYAVGPKASHLVAFSRGGDVVTAVPRLLMGLQRGWSETTLELPRGTWTNRLTGAGGLSGEQPVGSLFKEFPVALLARNA